MNNRLPSLVALRFFEAAGRLQSFSKAALELHVTQGAVSRQIRALENELGIKLFIRLTRKVELTEAGRKYLDEVSEAFLKIRSATDQLRYHQEHAILHISVLPSVGTAWVMPRLGSFTREYPNIETRISSSIEPANLHAGGVDVAIRVGPKPGHRYTKEMPAIDLEMTTDWRGILAEELVPDVLVPVYSPNILEEGAHLDDVRIFQNLPLIHTSSRSDAWTGWMRTHGLAELPATPRIEYGHFFMSLDAARQGLGVALIPELVLANSDTRGLYWAENYKVRSAGEYYLLSLAQRGEEYPMAAFRKWVRQQFQQLP